MSQTLTTIDLFCGAGGITEGFRQAGFDCIFANDVNPDAVSTWRHNHPGRDCVAGSIEALDPTVIRRTTGLARGELSCLVGGPPCQGFSINAPSRFLEDPRNRLFAHFAAFLDEFRPWTFMFENVPGLLSLGQGSVFRRIVNVFESSGYSVNARILLAANYGVPQERWRLIILGSRIGAAPDYPTPTHHANARANFTGGATMTLRTSVESGLSSYVSVKDAIGDLPRLDSGRGENVVEYPSEPVTKFQEKIREDSAHVIHHVAPRISPINLKRLEFIPPGGSWRDIPFELLPAGMKRARRSDHTKRYGRLHPDGLAGTVMTKMDPHWGPAFHYGQQRTLTVREAARLQSFPDRYEFAGSRVAQYEQIGNAVPVFLANAIAVSIRQYIENHVATETHPSEKRNLIASFAD